MEEVRKFCQENNLTFLKWLDSRLSEFMVVGGRKFFINYHDSGRIMGFHETTTL